MDIINKKIKVVLSLFYVLFVLSGIIGIGAVINTFPYYINTSGVYWINGTLKCNASPCIIVNTTQLVVLQGNSTGSLDSYGNLTIYINSTINTVNLIINHVYIYNTSNIVYVTSSTPILINISLENNTIVSSSEYFVNYTANPQNYIFKIINSNFETEQYLNNTVSGTLEIINSTTTKDIYCYSFNYNEFHALLIYNSTVYNISLYGGYGIVNVNLSNISKLYIQSYSKNTSYEEKIENSVFNIFANLNFIRNITINNCTFNYIRTGWTGTVTPPGQLYYYHNHLFLNNSKIYHEFAFVPGDTAVSFYMNDFMFCNSNLLVASPYPAGDPCQLGSWHALVENSTIIYNKSGNIGHNITIRYSSIIINGSIIYQHGVPNQTGIHLINSKLLEFANSYLYWGNILSDNSEIYIFDSQFIQKETLPSFLASLVINWTSYFNNSSLVFNNTVNIFNLTNTSDVISNSTIYAENFVGTTTAYRNVFNFITQGVYIGHGFINNTKIIINNTNIYTNLFHFNYAYVYLNNVTIINNSTNVYLNSIIRLDYGSFANITNTSFCVPFYIKYNLLFTETNSSSFIGHIWINPVKVSNITYVINWPDDSFYCNGTPLFKVYNELKLKGYFTVANIFKTPFEFDTKKIPFKFEENNYTIKISSIYEPKGEYILFQQNSNENYLSNIINKSTLIVENIINKYLGSMSFEDKNVLHLQLIPSTYYFIKDIRFNIPLKYYINFENNISISFTTNYSEDLQLCSTLAVFKRCVTASMKQPSAEYLIVYVLNLTSNQIQKYVILLTNEGGTVYNYIYSYVSTFGGKIIVMSFNSQENISLNKVLGLYSDNYIITYMNIGIIEAVTQTGPAVITYSFKPQLTLSIPNPSQLTMIDRFSINNLKVVAYSQGITYYPPFKFIISVNGEDIVPSTMIINTSKLEIKSALPLVVYGSIKLYGNLTFPFSQLNYFTYNTIYSYLYDKFFTIKSVYLYALPYYPFRIYNNISFKYDNGTIINKSVDLTHNFKLIFSKDGITYEAKNSFNFDYLGNILHVFPNFTLKFNTSWLKREPDIFVKNIQVKTLNNSPTCAIVTIKAINISNYTIPTNITNILVCGNKTFYYNTSINVSNKTTVYSFDLIPYIYNLSNITCNYTVKINPKFDIIRADNQLSTEFYIFPKKTGAANLTIIVKNASNQQIIPADIYIYYENGTLYASNTTNNGVVNITNINFSYYIIEVKNTSYYTYNKSVFIGYKNYTIIAYLVPKSVSKTKYGVLQVCILTKDREPVPEHNVSIYYTNGTFITNLTVNSTGCGSIVLTANLTYKVATFVNLTWYNKTAFLYPINVKPYTEVLIFTNILSNNIEPEALILYAKVLNTFDQNQYIPVTYAIYSSVPQNVTVNITAQYYNAGSWVYYKSIQYNLTFKEFKQVLTNTSAILINTSNVTTFRYVITIYPQSDTNTSNNQIITNNFTVFNMIDYMVTLFNLMQNVKPNAKFNISLMLNGTIKSRCNISLKESYLDPYTSKLITKTQYLNLTTNNTTNISVTVPYTNNLTLNATLVDCYLLKMDMNKRNNRNIQNITEISDARIIKIVHPNVSRSKNITINITIVSNYPLKLVLYDNNHSEAILNTSFGNNTYQVLITLQNTSTFGTNIENITISGDQDPYMNSYEFKIYYIGTKESILIIIIVILIILFILYKFGKLLIPHTLKDNKWLEVNRTKPTIKYNYNKKWFER